MTQTPPRSHGRKSIAATLQPRELITPTPDLVAAWKAQAMGLLNATAPADPG